MKLIFDPNSSLKASLGLPPIGTSAAIIDMIVKIYLGEIAPTSQPAEEIFGPVLPIMSFSTEEEAIKLANDSTFGLSASVWGEKSQVERVSRRIVTGNISINNVMVSEGNHSLPFGGVKDSGIGRYKGAMGLRAFCNVKSVLIDGNSKKIEANWYPYSTKKYGFFTGLTQALFKGNLVGFALNGMKLESYSQKAKRD